MTDFKLVIFIFRCHDQESQHVQNVLVSGSAQVDPDWSARFILAQCPVSQRAPGGGSPQ